jgi:hypothetical protein
MSINRREFVQTTGYAALGTAMTSKLSGIAQTAAAPATTFDIDQAFAAFMKVLGGSPFEGGGTVTFTGSDPILRSHFRIGSCMAIPAMAAGVGAAAIWKQRTGQAQDVKIDLREAIYNTMPLIAVVLQKKRAAGLIDPDDPIPDSFTFVPPSLGICIPTRSVDSLVVPPRQDLPISIFQQSFRGLRREQNNNVPLDAISEED